MRFSLFFSLIFAVAFPASAQLDSGHADGTSESKTKACARATERAEAAAENYRLDFRRQGEMKKIRISECDCDQSQMHSIKSEWSCRVRWRLLEE